MRLVHHLDKGASLDAGAPCLVCDGAGDPEKVAGPALFLASDRSRFSSGTAGVVDGSANWSLV
jgi:NAD(P)-dependent dehydrogenase (short-subunit alcohol dehydrogenase family)